MPDPIQSPRDATVSSLDVAVLFIGLATVAGVCLLMSSPPDRALHGAIAWADGSIMHALTTALAFNFQIPTPQGVAVKGLVAAVGACVLAVVVALGRYLAARATARAAVWIDDEELAAPTGRRDIPLHHAAAGLLAVWVVWSFASAVWSTAWDYAVAGSVVFLGQALWALGLGYGLSGRAARLALRGLCVILTVSAMLALWYYYERNRTLRLSFPIGNPLFMAACMIPVVTCGVARIAAGVQSCVEGAWRGLLRAALELIALVPVVWVLVLTDARSTAVGLAVALATLVILALPGWRSRAIALGAFALVALAGYSAVLQPLIARRGETVRERLLMWDYAAQLIGERPILGHGQGGYTRLADGLAAQDAVRDPRAVRNIIDHAHNEWLELLCDLGSFGVVVAMGVMALTLWAGVRALPRCRTALERWTVIGLVAGLAGMVIEECTDVALRIPVFPTVFFGIMGLIWAVVAPCLDPHPPRAPRWRPPVLLGMTVVVALGTALASIWDFKGARAQYEVRESLAKRQWADAAAQARVAARMRLPAARRQQAALVEIQCHLSIALAHLTDFENGLAALDRQRAGRSAREQAIERYGSAAWFHGNEVLRLVQRLAAGGTPPAHATMSATDAHMVLSRCTPTLEERRLHLEAGRATAALAWQRRPFDVDLVLRLIELSPELQPGDLIDLLCPAMFLGEVDTRYFERVQALAVRDDFESHFASIREAALDPDSTPEERPFAVEILRISAWVSSIRGEFGTARNAATRAFERALGEREPGSLSAAMAMREAAHYQFLHQPEALDEAIALAERSVAQLDTSYDASSSLALARGRLALYCLARGGPGDEAAAVRFASLATGVDGPPGERLLELYATLARTLIDLLPPPARPAYLDDRLRRWAELDVSSPLPALFHARHAFERGDVDGGIDHVAAADERGATVQDLYDLLTSALRLYPQDERLKRLQRGLLLVGPPAPA